MVKINLQFFGGRGSSSGDGPSLSGGGGETGATPMDTLIIEDYGGVAPNNRAFANEVETGVDMVTKDFPGVQDDILTEVDAAVFGGRDNNSTLGVYGGGMVAINANYTDVDKMNSVYDASTASGYHPGRGNYSGTQAVTYHEMGHALTDYVGKQMGLSGVNRVDSAAQRIVNDAYKNSKGKGGTLAWAKKISGYAQTNYAECVAEAVSDWYCNGNKASGASKAIIREMKKYS